MVSIDFGRIILNYDIEYVKRMSRPKSSVVRIIDLIGQGYNIRQGKKSKAAIDSLRDEIHNLRFNQVL